MKIQPVVIAAIKKDDKFLLTKRVRMDPEDKDYSPYVWHMPGGGIDYGETPEITLAREIKEELGVEIKIVSLLPKIFTDARRGWQGVFIVYLCQIKNNQPKITLNDESNEYNWFTVDQIPKLKLLPQTFEMIVEANKLKV